MLIGDYLLANAEIEKYFRSIFGSNENFKICFRDYLTFSCSDFVHRFEDGIKLKKKPYEIFSPSKKTTLLTPGLYCP